MRCEWCGQEIDFRPFRQYCSHACETAAMEHAVEALEALANGEDYPERPDKETIRQGKIQAQRWTPGRMRRRIKALESKVEAGTPSAE